MNNINIKNLIIEFDLLDENGAIKSRKRVIDNVSFSIAEGEFVCVLGKNGSGKSTLAKTLNSLIIPTSGDVEVYGLNTKIEDNIPKIRQLVGMAFQNPDNQIVASIVEEDIAFGLENIGIESLEIRNRIDDAMKNLEIYNLKDSIVSKLSGGQKQKV
ncbi:MAG: ATP-binding cassette domain-containing protein, partial [Lachnospiraceae bacterium]|nr:ATP-binding cassette domain-containing protein [Lachnospiraceae bacterium]